MSSNIFSNIYVAGGVYAQTSLVIGPSAGNITETATVFGNTSIVGNVISVTDVSGSSYTTARRVPAGSLSVSSYVTGSVPLTTTTNLIQNYFSNAAAVVTNAPTYNPALYCPATTNSWVQIPYQSAVTSVNTSNIFIEAWIYQTGTPGTTCIANSQGTGDDWGLRTITGSLQFFIYNTAVSAYINTYPTAMGTSSWQYVAMSFTGSNTTPYVYTFVGGTSGTATIAGNGTGTAFTGTPRLSVGNNLAIGGRGSELFQGYIYDLRIYKGTSIIKNTSFACPATPTPFGYTQPAYITGNAPTLHISMQAQYFSGASTSPYGPCLTLPGTLGSYYFEPSVTASPTNWKTYGFTVEGWVNYASFANSNIYYSSAPMPNMITSEQSPAAGGGLDWALGATTTGSLGFFFASTSPSNYYALTSPVGSLVTGQWTHIALQVSLTAMSLYINGVVQTLTAWNFTNTGTTTASNIPTTTPQLNWSNLGVGQYTTNQGPNAAIARARLVFGTVTTTGNVYNMSGFTASPNLGTVPVGVTTAWQLETQFPLPTYPYIQDVTELPLQASSYGSLPNPVGGVTQNTLSPYKGTTLQSLRFDGTGYVDYGNVATSALTTNLWANAWTIEAWIYPTGSYAGYPTIIGRSLPQTTSDFGLVIDANGILKFSYGASGSGYYGYYPPYNTWTHIALTYDLTNVSTYAAGTRQGQQAAVPASMVYTPTASLQIGNDNYSHLYIGNLTDVRVSNAAIYSGSSYTVPSAPLPVLTSTLLLLRSNNQQVGTTLEVQGRGLNSTSIGATRTVQAYPPAPMSSYLLDTTSNTSVTYGQGKYIASASSERSSPVYYAWGAFNKINLASTEWEATTSGYNSNSGGFGTYAGSVTTVDTLGNSYAGEWLQLQMPISVLLSNYQMVIAGAGYGPAAWVILGSRDGINWTLVNSQTNWTWTSGTIYTFNVGATQAYNYYRMVGLSISSVGYGYTALGMTEWTLNGTEESLCITNDAKVGVGIANPQRSLEVAGDLVAGGTVSAGNPLMYRNRIINGDMRIAQRGTSNVISTGAGAQFYMIDRFNFNSNFSTQGLLTQTQQTLTSTDTPYQLGFRYSWRITTNAALTSASYGYTEPQQNIEGYNTADLNWGTPFGSPITVSFWFRTNLTPGLYVSFTIRGGYQYSVSFAVIGNGTWQYVTATVPPPPNGTTWQTTNLSGIQLFLGAHGVNSYQNPTNTWVVTNYSGTSLDCNPYAQAGNYIEFTGVQLEKGTVATPFEFRPYATELALCQRYYQVFGPGNTTGYNRFGAGHVPDSTHALVIIPFQVTMRAAPTVFSNSAPNTFQINSGAASPVATAISTSDGSPTSAQLYLTVASGLTAGNGAICIGNATTSAFVGFGAEL